MGKNKILEGHFVRVYKRQYRVRFFILVRQTLHLVSTRLRKNCCVQQKRYFVRYSSYFPKMTDFGRFGQSWELKKQTRWGVTT